MSEEEKTCGEITCDECNDRYFALKAENAKLREEIEKLKVFKDDKPLMPLKVREKNIGVSDEK